MQRRTRPILEKAHQPTDRACVTLSSLRHTATTWLTQKGTDRWQAAGRLGMTLEQFEQTYGHRTRIQSEVARGVRQVTLAEQLEITD